MWNEMILKVWDAFMTIYYCTFGSKTSKEVKFWEKVKKDFTSINNSADISGYF